MLLTTTATVEGYPIQRYLGLVSGETISGVNVIKDITAGFRNFVGGRSASYEQEIQTAYNTAISEMSQRAQAMGANAIVGIRVDYFTAGTDNGMLAAIANGTAVIISLVLHKADSLTARQISGFRPIILPARRKYRVPISETIRNHAWSMLNHTGTRFSRCGRMSA